MDRRRQTEIGTGTGSGSGGREGAGQVKYHEREASAARFNVRHMARNADASFADQPEQLDSGVKRNAKS